MAERKYFAILTDIGQQKVSAFASGGEKVNITAFVVGDANGEYYTPTTDMTAIKNEVWRGVVSSADVVKDAQKVMRVSTVIPAEVNGFIVREMGLYDESGQLIAIGNTPPMPKVMLEEGVSTELDLSMRFAVKNTEALTFLTDPHTVIMTKDMLDTHDVDDNAHKELFDKKYDKTGGTISGNVIINGSVAEGKNTEASGRSSHAEGEFTTANYIRTHAEGNRTTASGLDSHAEGGGCIALKCGSHAEGLKTIAGGQYMLKPISIDTDTKKITFDTTYEGHSTAFSKLKEGTKLHAMTAKYSNHAILFTVVSIDTTNNSIVVEGNFTDYTIGQEIAIIDESLNGNAGASHAEGYMTKAMGLHSHAEGENTTASGINSHAEGENTTASSYTSHAEGNYTTASGSDSHAEGYHTTASGYTSHAEGDNTTASGSYSHAEGNYTTASGSYSHAEGEYTTASGNRSHAEGANTIANNFQTTIGKYNVNTTGGTESGTSGSVFVVGNGTSDSARSNCFRVQFNGYTYAKGSYSSSGADYAEYFQWQDRNMNNEDRTGLFVTLDGEEIRIANPDDNYILGVVSARPSIVGDVYDDQWKGMYETDIFGREVLEEIDVPAETIEIPDPNNPQNTITKIIKDAHKENVPKLNPNYNSNEKYIPRSERPEWSAIGMLGKLVAVDDGTCKVNGWCKVGEGGIAVKSEQKTRFKVMARLNQNHIRVMML